MPSSHLSREILSGIDLTQDGSNLLDRIVSGLERVRFPNTMPLINTLHHQTLISRRRVSRTRGWNIRKIWWVCQFYGGICPPVRVSFRWGCNRIKLHLKKPIETDEFLQRLTINWKGGECDNLGQAIAMQIISCPPDIYGPGGIGAQSLNTSPSKKPLKTLNVLSRNFCLLISQTEF